MNISFDLSTSDRELIYSTERELHENIDKFRAHLSKPNRAHVGRYIFRGNQNEPFLILDELWHLSLHLSFTSAYKLAQGEDVDYQIMASGEHVTFKVENETIRISDGKKSLSVDRKECIQQLVAVGLRYLDFLELLGDENHLKNKAAILDYAKEILTFFKESF